MWVVVWDEEFEVCIILSGISCIEFSLVLVNRGVLVDFVGLG